ncbi:nucleotidyltransferase family protein [Nonlabens ulvanivorans]|uniref:CBS domain protein n=1 Tax=Nonlabens ulvanivorans TaxID=906888 RepID=A0A084JVY0_NONUL|nr:nucleotidyltransferase family protein [Nonlabens ulvanivorans]KEZ93114.1 nucleotidyltransferase [Nonlabens ulvanivorans]PRX13767.1 CBS domain protein [Nonlabens ulvanivorans]
MDLNQITIESKATILDALNKLNQVRKVSRLILFVKNENAKIIGSVTDGDIRRSLALDQDLNKSVEEVCFKNFVHHIENGDFIDLSVYREQNIKILPVLNSDKTLSRILDLEITKSTLPLECMIMAGGRGKRLSPLTDSIPKPMLPLGDKPIIEHNIDRLISYGIQKIYISVKYLGEQLEAYFGDGSSKGIQIEYIWEEEPLGTAGALKLVDKFNTDYVLLMNSDLFTSVNFEEMYLLLLKENADMVVASTEYKVDVPYAVFETDGNRVKAFKEKPSYIYQSNAGIYILKKSLIDQMTKNKYCDITDVMEKLVQDGGKLVYDPILGFWIDIGKPSDYKQAQEFIKHFK